MMQPICERKRKLLARRERSFTLASQLRREKIAFRPHSEGAQIKKNENRIINFVCYCRGMEEKAPTLSSESKTPLIVSIRIALAHPLRPAHFAETKDARESLKLTHG
jgi:hypothetical protein